MRRERPSRDAWPHNRAAWGLRTKWSGRLSSGARMYNPVLLHLLLAVVGSAAFGVHSAVVVEFDLDGDGVCESIISERWGAGSGSPSGQPGLVSVVRGGTGGLRARASRDPWCGRASYGQDCPVVSAPRKSGVPATHDRDLCGTRRRPMRHAQSRAHPCRTVLPKRVFLWRLRGRAHAI